MMRVWLSVAIVCAARVAVAAPAGKKHESITRDLDCSACHSTAGWAMAPGGGRGFDHAKTGFPLRGAHATTGCTSCHDGRPKLTRECAGCHADAHAAKLGTACAECHTSVDWKDTRTLFRHQQTRLPLTGRHALLECTACHAAASERAFSNVPADCFACHEQDYRRADIHPNHVSAGFPRECGQCHRPSGWLPATFRPGMLPGIGLAAGGAPPGHDARFPLSFGKHRGAPCASCHPFADAPHVVACTGCHAHDAPAVQRLHAGRIGGDLGAGCLRCHPGGAAR